MMKTNVQRVVAEYTRDILASLSNPEPVPETENATTGNITYETGQSQGTIFASSCCQTLEGGSLLFEGELIGDITPWTLFVRAESQRDANLLEFRLRGQISPLVDAIQFVAASYRLVLNRAVDPDGEALYTNFLLSGKLTQRELLCILASSGEAQDRHERLLIATGLSKPEADRAALAQVNNLPYSVFLSA